MQTEKPFLPTVSLPVYFTLYLALNANEKHHKDERNIISLTSTDFLCGPSTETKNVTRIFRLNILYSHNELFFFLLEKTKIAIIDLS